MKPMLACPAPAELRFPYYASRKLDGVRCLIHEGRAKTRTLEHIPNGFVQQMLGYPMFEGLDGELVVGEPYADNAFQVSQSGVMSAAGEPDFTFYIFDYHNGPDGVTFKERLATLRHAFTQPPYCQHPRMRLLEQHIVTTMEELTDFQEYALEEGYEGLIIRSFDGPYKFGRSTQKQGYMMKVKRFVTGEAVVTAVNELMHNENDAELSNTGGTKRSTAKDGLVPGGLLGAVEVRDCESDVEFGIGSGFTLRDRAQLWADHTGQPVSYTSMDGGLQTHTVYPSGQPVIGRVAHYKHFEVGVKDKPRFPTFKGWRDARDMGEPK